MQPADKPFPISLDTNILLVRVTSPRVDTLLEHARWVDMVLSPVAPSYGHDQSPNTLGDLLLAVASQQPQSTASGTCRSVRNVELYPQNSRSPVDSEWLSSSLILATGQTA